MFTHTAVSFLTPGSTLLAAEIAVAFVVLMIGTLAYLATLWFVAGGRRRTTHRTAARGPEAPRGTTEIWARPARPASSERLLDHSVAR